MRVSAAILFLLLLICSGCTTGVTVATAASVAALAGSTLDTGEAVYSMGKLDTAERASRDECRQAVLAAAKDLGLRITTDKVRGDKQARLAMIDERDTVVDVWLDPRSPSLTLVRFDVGWFGSQPKARLVLSRFQYHLTQIRGDLPPLIETKPTTRKTAGPTTSGTARE